MSRAALLERATSQPETLSPNVLLRPLVQDTIFPTICYVAGPNELAYLGQLRGVYESFGLPMPLMHPRATATILDAAGVRFLNAVQGAARIARRAGRARAQRAARRAVAAVGRAARCRRPRPRSARAWTRSSAPCRQSIPTLEGAATITLGKIQHDMKNLRGKILQAAKRRDETLRRQFMHVRAQAFPGGAPQERTVGFVAFLNRYGPALVERLHGGAADRRRHALDRDGLAGDALPVLRVVPHTKHSRPVQGPDSPRPAKAVARRRRRFSVVCTLVLASASSATTGCSSAGSIDERLHGERERVLPRVYARPLELYRGQALGEQQLVDRLNDLGYAERAVSRRTGEFAIGRDAIVADPARRRSQGRHRPRDVRDAEATGLGAATDGAGRRWSRVTGSPSPNARVRSRHARSAAAHRAHQHGPREAPAGAACRRSRRAWCRRCWPSRTAGSTTTPASI